MKIKELLASAPIGVPVQLVKTSEGIEWRVGTYADRAITLEWTMWGWKLPYCPENRRRMTCREARNYLNNK